MKKSLAFLAVLLSSSFQLSLQAELLAPMPMMFDPDAMEVEDTCIDLMTQQGRSTSLPAEVVQFTTSGISAQIPNSAGFSSVPTTNVSNSIGGGCMSGFSRVMTDEETLSSIKNQASRAQASGNTEDAALYTEASEQLDRSLEYKRQAAQANALGNKEEASCLYGAASSARSLSFSLGYSTIKYLHEAKPQNGRNPEVAMLWSRALAQDQRTIEYYRQSIEAYLAGNKELGERLGRYWPSGSASWAANLSTRELATAAEYLTKAQVVKNPGSAALFMRAVEQYQVASEYFHQAAQAAALGNENEGKGWSRMGCSISHSSKNLADAADSLIKAQAEQNSENAALLVKEANQSQIAAEYYLQAVQTYAAGNKEEGKSYDQKAWKEEPTTQRLMLQGGFWGGLQ
ncbi:MAG TPA: hypothetical protein VJK54_03395 [Chthoniobacterales bacterium]|nr:hypothetical protein [Chthoniobacterales bacterium]